MTPRTLIAGLAALLLPVGAGAQIGHGVMPGVASVQEIWSDFEAVCDPAVSNPDAFVASHPRTGADGSPRVVGSDDGNVLVLYSDVTAKVFYQIEYLRIPDHLEVLCEFHGNLAGQTDILSGNLEALARQREAELRALIAARPRSSIGGGPFPSRDMALSGLGQHGPGGALNDRIFAIETPLAGDQRFVYANIVGGAMSVIGHYRLPAGAHSARQGASANPAPDPAPAASPSPSFEEATRANLALAIEICVRGVPVADTLMASLAAAGFAHSVEDHGGGELLHRYSAPADTALVTVTQGQLPSECRVGSNHMGVTEAVAFLGDVLNRRFPGVFTYGNIENTEPVTAETMGSRREMCTGYIGWSGQRPIYTAIGNQGQDPACVADGTVQIVIGM